jgi:tetratricopeptide (TPR) repeat protein
MFKMFYSHEAKDNFTRQVEHARSVRREFGEDHTKSALAMMQVQEVLLSRDCFVSYNTDAESRSTSLVEIACAYAQNDMAEKAMRLFNEAAACFPCNITARINLGFNYFLQHNWSAARDHLKFVLQGNPAFKTTHLCFAFALAKTGKLKQANRAFFEMCGVLPDESEVLRFMDEHVLKIEFLVESGIMTDMQRVLEEQGRPVPSPTQLVKMFKKIMLRPEYVPNKTDGAAKLFELHNGYFMLWVACRLAIADALRKTKPSYSEMIEEEDAFYQGSVVYCKRLRFVMELGK